MIRKISSDAENNLIDLTATVSHGYITWNAKENVLKFFNY